MSYFVALGPFTLRLICSTARMKLAPAPILSLLGLPMDYEHTDEGIKQKRTIDIPRGLDHILFNALYIPKDTRA